MFGTASAFIRLASGACLVLALVLLVRKFGSWAGAALFIGSTVFGVAIGYWLTSENIIFFDFLYSPLQLAQDADVVLPGTIDRLKSTVMFNMIVGIGACGALLAAFSSVAVRAQPAKLTAACLRKRKGELELLSIRVDTFGIIDRSQQSRTRLAARANVPRHREVVWRPRWSSRQSLGGERNRRACLCGRARCLFRLGRY